MEIANKLAAIEQEIRKYCLWKHEPIWDNEKWEYSLPVADCKTQNTLMEKSFPGGTPISGHSICPVCTIADQLAALRADINKLKDNEPKVDVNKNHMLGGD